MRDDEIRPGVEVTITSDRVIGGRTWRGQRGRIYGEFRRGEVPDWCVIRVRFGPNVDDILDLAYPPAEIEPVGGEQP
jgi:hypothetical protein